MEDQKQDPDLDDVKYFEREAGVNQRKFLYFMIGLTFAVLGLSIQVSDNVTLITKIAWVSLMVSGLFGIMRVEWDNSVLMWNRDLAERLLYKSQLEEAKRSGAIMVDKKDHNTVLDVDEWIRIQDKSIARINKALDKLGGKQEWRYNIHMWGFVIGIMGLAIDKILFS